MNFYILIDFEKTYAKPYLKDTLELKNKISRDLNHLPKGDWKTIQVLVNGNPIIPNKNFDYTVYKSTTDGFNCKEFKNFVSEHIGLEDRIFIGGGYFEYCFLETLISFSDVRPNIYGVYDHTFFYIIHTKFKKSLIYREDLTLAYSKIFKSNIPLIKFSDIKI